MKMDENTPEIPQERPGEIRAMDPYYHEAYRILNVNLEPVRKAISQALREARNKGIEEAATLLEKEITPVSGGWSTLYLCVKAIRNIKSVT